MYFDELKILQSFSMPLGFEKSSQVKSVTNQFA